MEFCFHDTDRNLLILRADAALDSFKPIGVFDELQRLIDGGARKLVVDCSRLGYISSVGIASLIRIHKRLAEAGGDVKLASVQPPLARLLDITRLREVFGCYPSIEAARQAFAADAARA